MVAFKTGALKSALKSFRDGGAVLLYGTDAGLVAERAEAFVRQVAGKRPESTEMVRLDERDFAEDPARMEVELRTLPMFAERKVVRVTANQRLDVASLKSLLDGPPAATLIVEAGALRADSALRKLFERHATAIALACYGEERNIAELIGEELGKAGLEISTEAKAYLVARLGADQILSRAEIAKLAVYASGEGEVRPEDIDAVVGDSAEIAVENFVYAVSAGEMRDALNEIGRLAAAGTDPQAALSALGRHFTRLHRVASAPSAEQAIRFFRPPLNFKRKDMIIAHARRLGPRRLLESLPLIQNAVRQSRLNPELERAIAEELIVTLTATRRVA
jgi:DNA polymerase-3 subunit delta